MDILSLITTPILLLFIDLFEGSVYLLLSCGASSAKYPVSVNQVADTVFRDHIYCPSYSYKSNLWQLWTHKSLIWFPPFVCLPPSRSSCSSTVGNKQFGLSLCARLGLALCIERKVSLCVCGGRGDDSYILILL